MGKYYKLNENNIVENVILAEQDFIDSQPDKEKYIKIFETQEEKNESLYNSLYSLNHGFINDYYNFEKRKFKSIKPYESWIWNKEKYEWEAPVEKPHSVYYLWNEEKQEWIKYED
jgi:hypothetical protein